jgi:hypothetical protein
LPCVFCRRTAKTVTRRLTLALSVAFFLAVRLLVTHGKHSSPCVVRRNARQWEFTVQNCIVCSLPCTPTKNTRGKVFTVRFRAFVVRPGRTANPVFPVVCIRRSPPATPLPSFASSQKPFSRLRSRFSQEFSQWNSWVLKSHLFS